MAELSGRGGRIRRAVAHDGWGGPRTLAATGRVGASRSREEEAAMILLFRGFLFGVALGLIVIGV